MIFKIKSDQIHKHQSARMPYVCPVCTPQEPGNDTYASVLVFGAGQLGSTLDEIKRVAKHTSVANISSYCMRCMHITPSFNTDVSVQENMMEWQRKHAFYTSCEAFIQEWPKKRRVNRLRKLDRNEGAVQEATSP